MHIEKSTVGLRLKLLRENCGYTQQQIANVLNIDRSTYAYYETGKTFPDINTFFALARIFNVDILDILEPEDPVTAVADPGAQKPPVNVPLSILPNTSHIYELSKNEKQIICGYRAATPEQRKLIFETILEVLREPNPEEESR